jgi:hypothetical protein
LILAILVGLIIYDRKIAKLQEECNILEKEIENEMKEYLSAVHKMIDFGVNKDDAK